MAMYKLEQIIEVDDITKNINVISSKYTQLMNPANKASFILEKANLTDSSFEYSLLCYGARSPLNNFLTKGVIITVIYNSIQTKTRIGTVKGRISGLSRIIGSVDFRKNFLVGDTVNLIFDPISMILEIKK